MDDLIIVAFLDADLSECSARDDLQVALNRNAKRVDAELAKHLGDGDSAANAAFVAIHPDRDAAIENH